METLTLPYERTRAVLKLGEAVSDLMPLIHRRGEHVKVEREKIVRLVRWLRHYPTEGDVALTAELCPELWGEPE